VANVPRAKDALRSSSSEKTPEPALPSNKEPSVYNCKPLKGSHTSASDSHIFLEGYSTMVESADISHQIPPEVACWLKKPVKLGNFLLPF
jgi:hypothetical protein